MYCPFCGVPSPDGVQFCSSCGKPLGNRPPKTSGLAIASLVLGICGFLCGLSAIPGLIFGIVGLRKIGRSGGQLTGSGLAIAGIAVSGTAILISLIILPAMLMPALARARMEAMKAVSRSNLHNIGLGLALYDQDHRRMPASLAELHPDFVSDLSVFVDPGDNQADQEAQLGFPCSYVYVGQLPVDAPFQTIICYTRRGIYPDGRNVLRQDITVDWVTEEQLQDPGGDLSTSLRASYEAIVNAVGDNLTEERKAELQKFYEVQD